MPLSRQFPQIALRFALAASAAAPTLALTRDAHAELELPRASPTARVYQQIGLTEVEVEYASPAVKGRRIFGAAVPYDKPWALSPDRPATIRFGRDVTVGGKPVSAGRYVLTAVPARGDWTILLARATAPTADGKAPGEPVKVKAHARATPTARERLTFLFSDASDESASLDLEWERVRVSLPIATNTAAQVRAEIEELDGAWRSYANAARYMLETQKDFDAGLKYADRSLALKEDWYTLWIKAALLAAKQDFRSAVTQGERAYALGQQAGDGFVLEPELKKAIADWKRR